MRRSAGGSIAFDTPPHYRPSSLTQEQAQGNLQDNNSYSGVPSAPLPPSTPPRQQHAPVAPVFSTTSSDATPLEQNGSNKTPNRYPQYHALNLGQLDAHSHTQQQVYHREHTAKQETENGSLRDDAFSGTNSRTSRFDPQSTYLDHQGNNRHGSPIRSPYSNPGSGNYRENVEEDEEEENIVRNYEHSGAVLPTYSPASTPRLRAHQGAVWESSGRQGSSSRTNSPTTASRRYGAGVHHSTDSSAHSPSASAASSIYRGGEDKMAEKAALGGRYANEKAGGYPKSFPANAAGGKYAKLIPEQRPPKSPLDYVQAFFQNEACVLILYTLLSLFTRLWKIGKNASVVWDEAHFGKFGSHYLKHEFYFDVHPPLGKMLVGFAGLLSGYGGQFEFKSGEAYPGDVNYVGMRIMLAMFGVAMVPIAYSTSGALGWNWRARHLLAIMVLCDNAWLVISRFILLDSMLLFFTFTTVHGLVMFNAHRREPFSDMWWFWITFTGVSIGCVASVKWVGLFVTALVGLYTIEDLWDKFGDLHMPVRRYARHWCARILCLIVVPLSVYMATFKMHFMVLSRSGPGDAQMSSLFQSHLRGSDFGNSPLEAAYGSKITLKNMGYGGGLLHSHVQTYPVGSQQQQVTCYHYKDNNNEFRIDLPWEEGTLPPDNATYTPRMLKSGDTIRLVHAMTGRNIHSHTIAAPITKENYEVSAYGNATIGDSNDYWVVEVVDDIGSGKKAKKGDPVRSLTTRMRFRHQNLGCYLYAGRAILPQWGWKQVEVSCVKENMPKDEHTYWNIEHHWNHNLPPGNAKMYRSPFLRDFIHLNVAMMMSNNALIPDQDKDDILASKPFDWPWLYNGLRMNGWSHSTTKYYLVGNIAVWWGSSLSLIAFCFVLLWYKGRMQRRIHDLSPQDWEQFTFGAKVAGYGYLLHYMPFLIMGRVLYIHHYLPILYFAVLMTAHLLDHFLWNASTARYRTAKSQGIRQPLSATVRNGSFAFLVALVFGVFWYFRDTAWGIDGPAEKRFPWKPRKTWNLTD